MTIMRKFKIGILIMLFTVMVGCTNKLNEDNAIVTINNEDITVGYYEKTLRLQKQAIEDVYGNDIKSKEQFKDEVLNQIINIYSICQEVEKNDLEPTAEEIDKQFKEVKNNINSNTDYKKKLEKLGIDDSYIRQQQVQDLMLRNFKKKFNETVEVTDKEIKEYYEINKDEYELEFESVKDSIKMNIINNKYNEEVKSIKDKSKIEKNEYLLEQVKL